MGKSALDYYDEHIATQTETIQREYDARKAAMEDHRDILVKYIQGNIQNLDGRIVELDRAIRSYEAKVTAARTDAAELGGFSKADNAELLALIQANASTAATAQRGAAADADRKMEAAKLADTDWTPPPEVAGRIAAGMPDLVSAVNTTGDITRTLNTILGEDANLLKASSGMSENQRRVLARDFAASLVSAGVNPQVAELAVAGGLQVPAGSFDPVVIEEEKALAIEEAKRTAPTGGSGEATTLTAEGRARIAELRAKRDAALQDPRAKAALQKEKEDREFLQKYVASPEFDRVVQALEDGTLDESELTPEERGWYRTARAIAMTTPGAVDQGALRYFDRSWLELRAERAGLKQERAGEEQRLGTAADPITRPKVRESLADVPPGYANIPDSKKPLAMAAWRAVRGGATPSEDAKKLHRMLRDGSLQNDRLVMTAAEMSGGDVRKRDELLAGVMTLQNEVNRSTMPTPQATVEKPVEEAPAPQTGMDMRGAEGLF